MILRLCERFSCLPSQLLAEDAGLLRLLRIEAYGKTGDTGDGEQGQEV